MCVRGRVAHSPGSGSTKFYAEVFTYLLSGSLTQNCWGLSFSQQLCWTLGVGKSSGLWVKRLNAYLQAAITRCMTLDTLIHQRGAHFFTCNVRALIYKFSGFLYSSQHVPPRSSWKLSHNAMCVYGIVNNMIRQWETYFNSWRKLLP